MTRSIPMSKATSVPGPGFSTELAKRIRSVSRELTTMSFAPLRTAFLTLRPMIG